MNPMPILLLPGLDGTGDLFDGFVAVAPPQFLPIVVSLPADGSSYEELLEAIRPRLPATGMFAVVGESFSGPLAIAVAREKASQVAAVILCNSFVSAPMTSVLRFLPWRWMFAVRPPAWVIRRLFVGADASARLVSAVRDAVAKTPAAILARRMHAVFTLPRPDAQPSIQTPVLVLSGENDLLPDTMNAIRQVAPRCTIGKIPGPHLLLQTVPVEAWVEIAAFVEAELRSPSCG